MGSKKKSLANKLAKMSDEDRARYLQHKADMEEEARRRKEQLISTFLKKKIKKEEMFSRLNLAKINQHWHQILRKSKCQEMRENVEHMKNWIERTIDYKNRTISKLMDELEEAEEQYSNNFQSHSTYINNIIEQQQESTDKFQKQYEEDLKQLLETSKAEKESILKNAKMEQEHLQTVLYGQETEGKKTLKATYERYRQKEYEAQLAFDEKFKELTGSRNRTIEDIWRQIAALIDLYVQKMDSVRVHYSELRNFDAESAAEADENEERIKKQEELIQNLKTESKSLFIERDRKLKTYRKELSDLKLQFLKAKQQLQKELQSDEKKLTFISNTSSATLRSLESLDRKGEQIKNLASTCEKLKTQREVLARWLPVTISNGFIKTYEGRQTDDKKEDLEAEFTKKEESSVMKILEDTLPGISKPRPKTALTGRTFRSSRSVSITTTPDSRKITTIRTVTLQSKHSLKKSSSSSSSSTGASPTTCPDILQRCLTSLESMENFWFVFNKTEVDFMELKEEKRNLEEENKNLRGMIRAVLETVALAQTIPNSRVSTRVSSKRRSAQSAPPRRSILV